MGIGLIIAIFAIFKIDNNVYTYDESKEAESWSRRMDVENTGTSLIYTMKLPAEDITDKIIAFDTSHAEAEVVVGDTLIYSLTANKDSFVKTTGTCWNYVIMHEEYAGQPITITLKSVYGIPLPKRNIFYGRQSSVTMAIAKNDILKFTVCILILVLGLVMFFYAFFIAGKDTHALKHFALFTVLLGAWQVADSSLCTLMIPWSVGLSLVAHTSLMLMPMPFLLFLRTTFQDQDNPLWYIYCIFNCCVVCLRIALQLLAIQDMRESLWMTHISIVVFIIVGLYLSIKELIINKITHQMRLNIICFLIIITTTFIDLMHYRVTANSSAYGAIGFLTYTVIVGMNIIMQSRSMLLHAQENEIYRKLAFTDELTGLFNRTAFKQDMDNQTKTDSHTGSTSILPTVILMFDLNDLKKCNDNFGHEYGDQYIIAASSIIERVFGSIGRCYRIGGDEFCALLTSVSKNEVKNKLGLLRRRIAEQNRKPFVVTMEIAAGYAIYDPKTDQTLDDTMKRADDMMYENKRQLKAG